MFSTGKGSVFNLKTNSIIEVYDSEIIQNAAPFGGVASINQKGSSFRCFRCIIH